MCEFYEGYYCGKRVTQMIDTGSDHPYALEGACETNYLYYCQSSYVPAIPFPCKFCQTEDFKENIRDYCKVPSNILYQLCFNLKYVLTKFFKFLFKYNLLSIF